MAKYTFFFQNNNIHSFKPMAEETLHQELPPHIYTHAHTYTFTDLNKVILACVYPKETVTVLAMYLII